MNQVKETRRLMGEYMKLTENLPVLPPDNVAVALHKWNLARRSDRDVIAWSKDDWCLRMELRLWPHEFANKPKRCVELFVNTPERKAFLKA